MFKRIICGLICFGLFLGNTPVFAQATTGRTTLRQAIMRYAQAGDVKSLQKIRARGYDIDVPDENANSALCEAVWRGDSDAAATLIKAGANQDSSCMKRIPKEYKKSAGMENAEKQKMMQLDLDTVSQNGSPAVVGVASKEATLTTGAMVGIGVGVAALVGGGIALASHKDNNSDEKPKSTEVCPPGYTGEDCKLCADGFDHYGSPTECFKTLTCYHGGWQIEGACHCIEGYYVGDNCQTCDVGYGWHGSTECWPDIACVNGVQLKDTCVCETGYVPAEDGSCTVCAEGYGKHGGEGDDKCYPDINCGSHGEQFQNSCICEGNWTGATCATCRLKSGGEGSLDTESCECNEHFVEQGNTCVPDPDCIGVNAPIDNCAEQTSCWSGLTQKYTCETCVANFDISTNCSTCIDGYTLSGNECIETCPGAVKDQSSIPNCAVFTACEADETMFYCETCSSGYIMGEDGRCYTETDRIALWTADRMNQEIPKGDPVTGNADFYGLYYENNIMGGAYTKTKGDSVTNSFYMERIGVDDGTKIGDMAGIYTTKGDAYGSNVNAKNASASNTIHMRNESDGNIYGISAKGTAWGARLEKAVTSGSEGKSLNTIEMTNIGDGKTYGLYGYEGVRGAYVRTGTAVNNIEITNTGDGEVYGFCTLGNSSDDIKDSVRGAATPVGNTTYSSAEGAYAVNNLTINNTGDGNVYGFNTSEKNIKGAWTERKETKADNNVIIVDVGDGDVYGFKNLTGTIYGSYGEGKSTDAYIAKAGALNVLSITNSGSGNIYGFQTSGKIYGAITNASDTEKRTPSKYASATNSISITNTYTTDDDMEREIVGLCQTGSSSVYGADTHGGDAANIITITNKERSGGEAPKIYGIKAEESTGVIGALYYYVENLSTDGSAVNTINIANMDDGQVYGISAKDVIGAKSDSKSYQADNTINIYNYSVGNALGIRGDTVKMSYNNAKNPDDETSSYAKEKSTINIYGVGAGNVCGIFTSLTGVAGSVTIQNTDSINIVSVEANPTTLAFGVYADKDVSVTNNGNITISHEDYVEKRTGATPKTYYASEETGFAVGIYVVGGNTSKKTITNTGNITISGFGDNGYGIYVENGDNVVIKNSGTITIDKGSYSGDIAFGNFIVLNGGNLLQSGVLSVGELNATASNLTLGSGSQTIVSNNFYGTATVDSDTVMNGFNTTYTEQGMISAGNVDDLNLVSGSYLFNASLADNNSDVVMTKKSFGSVVENKSLAAFLENNYALGNNEAFFNEIKGIGNAASFKSAMDSLTAADTIAKFTHEDLTAMREVNLQMNEKMFANNDKPVYQAQGTVNGFSFKNDNHSSANYALGTKRIAPRWKVGYAMSRTNVHTDDDKDTTHRSEVFQAFAPIGYERGGVQLISTPQVGFARGHYTRKGYNGMSYKGIIEKRIFALMNEARYPVDVMGITFAPTVEFNAIAYNQKGSEDNKQYALTMPSENQLSVEAGMGLYANKQIGRVNFNTGLMMYKEFADPYNVKMGMQGMEGTFNLYDEDREYRGVASFGFNYGVNAWDIYGKVQHFIENDNHTNVKAGLKYTF